MAMAIHSRSTHLTTPKTLIGMCSHLKRLRAHLFLLTPHLLCSLSISLFLNFYGLYLGNVSLFFLEFLVVLKLVLTLIVSSRRYCFGDLKIESGRILSSSFSTLIFLDNLSH